VSFLLVDPVLNILCDISQLRDRLPGIELMAIAHPFDEVVGLV